MTQSIETRWPECEIPMGVSGVGSAGVMPRPALAGEQRLDTMVDRDREVVCCFLCPG